MNLVFALTNDKSWKSLLVENDRLLLINKCYQTPEEFNKGYSSEGLSAMMKSKLEIFIPSILHIRHEEHDNKLIVTDGDKKTELEFADHTEMQSVAGFIANQRKFNRNIENMGTFDSIKGPGIGLLITLGLGWLIYTEAKTIEAGGTIDTSGRRSLYKKAFAWLAETLGPTGTLAVTGLIAAAFIFFLYQRFKKPPTQVVYA